MWGTSCRSLAFKCFKPLNINMHNVGLCVCGQMVVSLYLTVQVIPINTIVWVILQSTTKLKDVAWSYGSWFFGVSFHPTHYRQGVLNTILSNKVCQWFVASWLFSPGTLVSCSNKTVCHDIAEILLKVALKTITLTQIQPCTNSDLFGEIEFLITILHSKPKMWDGMRRQFPTRHINDSMYIKIYQGDVSITSHSYT